jgi:hypothetical protein
VAARGREKGGGGEFRRREEKKADSSRQVLARGRHVHDTGAFQVAAKGWAGGWFAGVALILATPAAITSLVRVIPATSCPPTPITHNLQGPPSCCSPSPPPTRTHQSLPAAAGSDHALRLDPPRDRRPPAAVPRLHQHTVQHLQGNTPGCSVSTAGVCCPSRLDMCSCFVPAQVLLYYCQHLFLRCWHDACCVSSC